MKPLTAKAKQLVAALCFLLLTVLATAPPGRADNDVLRLAIPYPLTRLDPLALNDPLQRIVMETSAHGLSLSSSQNGVSLATASGLRRSADALRWHYSLSENITFSNGDRLETGEIIRIYNQYRRAALHASARQVPYVSSLLNIDRVEEKDEGRGVEFLLKTPDASFAQTAGSLPLFHIRLLSAFGDRFGSGTQIAWVGPYEVIENRDKKGLFLSASGIALAQGFKGPPHIVFRLQTSPEHVLNQLRYGALDIIPLPTSDQIRRAKNDPSLLVLPSPLVNLAEISGAWRLPVKYWGTVEAVENRLQTDLIIVRAHLRLSEGVLQRFDLRTLELGAVGSN